MPQFRRTVDEGNLTKAVELHHQSSWKGIEERLNYVVDKQDSGFIFDFARLANIDREELLIALFRKKSPRIIEEAFKVFEFKQFELFNVALDPRLMCSPDDFLDIFVKIENEEDQEYNIIPKEYIIEQGVWGLLPNGRSGCVLPLLHALGSKKSMKHFKNIAIKVAFERGSWWGNKPIVQHLYDHPTVTPEVYATGLINSGESPQNPIFDLLLENADQDDLIAVKMHKEYGCRSEEFKQAIERTISTAKPGGTRVTFSE